MTDIDAREIKSPAGRRYRGLATASAFASLFSYAIVLIITQSLNNQVKAEYQASFSKLGWLAPCMMAGFFTAVLVAGHYSDRVGKLPMVLTGALCMAAGALMFAVAGSFPLAAAAMLVMGIGGGCSEGASSALISDLYAGPRRASMMNLSQAAFGVGAIVVPIATGSLLKLGIDWRFAYLGTAVVCLATGALTLTALLQRFEKPLGIHAGGGWRAVLRDPLIMFLSVGILLYVGAELGQSNWMSVYFLHNLHADAPLAAMSLSAMWFGIFAGRMIAAWVLRHITESALLCWSLGLAALSEASLLLVGSPVPGLVTSFALGTFLGPVFPTIVSRAGAAYPSQSGLATGMLISVGSLGFAIFPPIIGKVADSAGLRPALWICVAILIANFTLFAHLRRSRRP